MISVDILRRAFPLGCCPELGVETVGGWCCCAVVPCEGALQSYWSKLSDGTDPNVDVIVAQLISKGDRVLTIQAALASALESGSLLPKVDPIGSKGTWAILLNVLGRRLWPEAPPPLGYLWWLQKTDIPEEGYSLGNHHFEDVWALRRVLADPWSGGSWTISIGEAHEGHMNSCGTFTEDPALALVMALVMCR